MRRAFLGAELAVYLRRRNYDLVWTQWPDVYGAGFWRTCRVLGLPLAHTVHNALPHEDPGAQAPLLRRVYAPCDLLFIHSEQARRDFIESFPEFGKKLSVTPHGLYTVYPRSAGARGRVREELGLAPDGLVALVCGGIRPYKNVDAVLAALADPRCARLTLVVAGEESGYGDASAGDPLSRTRRLAAALGVTDRVRFIPRFLRATELAELLEAVDILALPYRRSYGSGLLLLGMTFGKHILTTDTGGAAEYLADYPAHTLLQGESAADVAAGLLRAGGSIAPPGAAPPPRAARLEWPAIARVALDALRDAL